jgi:hypothetical protein
VGADLDDGFFAAVATKMAPKAQALAKTETKAPSLVAPVAGAVGMLIIRRLQQSLGERLKKPSRATKVLRRWELMSPVKIS